MKIRFLGTNGWYDSQTGRTICTLIETKNEYIILDAGFGLQYAKKYIKTSKPIYLFISHAHIDHICGLHGLCGLHAKQGLTIICSQSVKNSLAKIITEPYTISFKKLGFPIKFKIIKAGKYNQPFKFEVNTLKHISPTLGIRLALENKAITYCCDTARCQNDIDLAKNSDVLIHESSFAPTVEDFAWGHTCPDGAAKIAKAAKVKKLILTHFDAGSYFTNDQFDKAKKAAKKIFPNTILARDGMIINA